MRVLIVGSDKHWAIENYFLDHFQSVSGVAAELFPAHHIFHKYYYRSIFNKIRFRLGLSSIYQKINEDLLDYVSEFQPDIVWVFKGMEIFPATLEKIKASGTFLANYNPDHPFEYAHKGSGNANVRNSIPLYDLHFSYSKNILKQIRERYGIAGEWLPFAYQPVDNPPHIPEEDIRKVCFIGNPDKIRAELIGYLAERGLPIDVYGNGWQKFANAFADTQVGIHPPVFQEAFSKTAVQYRVQLNVFRPQNEGSHNMRTFEMPALGCIMLAPYSEEHIELFEENQEAFYYRNREEAYQKAKEILALPKEKAMEIKKSVQARSQKSRYTYEDRAKQVLKFFENYLRKVRESDVTAG